MALLMPLPKKCCYCDHYRIWHGAWCAYHKKRFNKAIQYPGDLTCEHWTRGTFSGKKFTNDGLPKGGKQ